MEILSSSRRHGIADEDIQHCIENALLIEEVADDPVRYLVLGPDQAGNLLELVVPRRTAGTGDHPRHEDATKISTSLTKERLTWPEHMAIRKTELRSPTR